MASTGGSSTAARRASPATELPRLLGTLADITDRRDLEAELHQAQKMEAIGQLTGGVAHDFNNLLTVITGNLELALGRVEDRHVAEMLRLAMDATEKGAALTQRLLAFARRQTLSPYAIDLAALVADLRELLGRTLGSGIEIATSVSGDLWPALVDASQLENAMLNLAINARDAMPFGGRLSIEATNCEVAEGEWPELKPGRYVSLVVRDSGQGMSPEIRAKAVQPFFTTKEIGKGSGLGLSMVYGFVKQTGGHVDIVSEIGRGTAVQLILPVAPPHCGRDPPPVRGTTPCSARWQRPRGRRRSGRPQRGGDDAGKPRPSVTTAIDGPSALRWIKEGGPFDLMLTDIVLPGSMNGVQLANTALEQRPGLRGC